MQVVHLVAQRFAGICCVLAISFLISQSNIYAMDFANSGYDIKAGTLTYVPEKARVFLKNNVIIENQSFTIQSQEVDIILDAKQEGLSFTSDSVQEIFFRNSVTFVYRRSVEDAPIHGKGNTARYNVANKMLYVSGNVQVETEGNTMEGEDVTVNLATNDVRIQGSNKKPVELIIRPR